MYTYSSYNDIFYFADLDHVPCLLEAGCGRICSVLLALEMAENG